VALVLVTATEDESAAGNTSVGLGSAWKDTGSKSALLHLFLLCPSDPEIVSISIGPKYNVLLFDLVSFDL